MSGRAADLIARAGRAGALTALAALVAACGEPAADYSAVPRGFPVPDPPEPVADLRLTESYSVEIEDRLFTLGQALADERPGAVAALLSHDFRGDRLSGLAAAAESEFALGARRLRHDPASAEAVDGAGFVDGVRALFAGWEDVRHVRWEVLAAEFQPARPPWGKARLQMEAVGGTAAGGVRGVTAVLDAQVLQDRGQWLLRAADLVSLETQSRAAPLFADVSAEAGIAYEGSLDQEDARAASLRRQPFNGAAAGDVDGDGDWDLFVSGKERNFLYLNRGDGSFDEAAEAWGVARPGDGSGAVFFDYDNDHDQDLFLAGEGWHGRDGAPRGRALRMYRNDGGHFTEVAAELGLDVRMIAQTVTVLDYDGDGWLDLYVCNYGLRKKEDNNSWTDGDNGEPDALFRNLGGAAFENVAAEAGVDQTRWSYASGAADFDRDGDQDVYVAHDYAVNAFYRNRGDGTFEDVSAELTAEDLGFGMGVNWGDLDNDGRLDVYVANMHVPAAERILSRLGPGARGMEGPMKLSRGNTVLLQNEDGSFRIAPEELGGIKGLWAWGCAVNDFDLDGRLDVFCTNGFYTRPGVGDIHSFFWRHVVAATVDPESAPGIGMRETPNNDAFRKGRVQRGRAGRSWGGHERDKLWLNRGDAGFLDVSDVSGADSAGDGRAAVALDFDADGDVDLFLNEWSYSELNRQILLRNDMRQPPAGFLAIRLRATRGQYQAVGAEVMVETPAGPCSQVLAFGNGFVSSPAPELVFGLGEAGAAQVEVLWPGGARESFGKIAAGSRVLLVEGSGRAEPLPSGRTND